MPTLECPNGIVNIESEYNFINFCDAIANYFELTYGDTARIFRTGDYPKYERKEYNATEYTEEADPLRLKRTCCGSIGSSVSKRRTDWNRRSQRTTL